MNRLKKLLTLTLAFAMLFSSTPSIYAFGFATTNIEPQTQSSVSGYENWQAFLENRDTVIFGDEFITGSGNLVQTPLPEGAIGNTIRQSSQGNASSRGHLAFTGLRRDTIGVNNLTTWNTSGAGGNALASTDTVGLAVDLLSGASADTPWPLVDTVVLHTSFANGNPFTPPTTARGIGRISVESGSHLAFSQQRTGNVHTLGHWGEFATGTNVAQLEYETSPLWQTFGEVITIESDNTYRIFTFTLPEPMPVRYLKSLIEIIVPDGATNLPSQVAITSFEAYNSQAITEEPGNGNDGPPVDPDNLPNVDDLGWNTVAGIQPRGTTAFSTFSDFLTSGISPDVPVGFWGTAPSIHGMGHAGSENLAPVGLNNMTHFRQTSQGNANSSAFFAFNGLRSNTFATNNQQGWNTNAAGGQALAETGNVGIAVDLLAGAPAQTPWPLVDTIVLYAAYANFLPFAPSTTTARGIDRISIESGTASAFGAGWMTEIVDDGTGLMVLENTSSPFWRTVGDVVTIEQGNDDRVFIFHLERPMPMRYLRANIEVVVPPGGANLPSQIAINAIEAYNSHAGATRPWIMFDDTSDTHHLGATTPVVLTFRENGFPLESIKVNGETLIENADFTLIRDELVEIVLTQNFLNTITASEHQIDIYFTGYGTISHTLTVSGVVLQANATRVFEINSPSTVRFDFILSGATLTNIYANGTRLTNSDFTTHGTHFTDGTNRLTDRLNVLLEHDFLNGLTGDVLLEFGFINGETETTLAHTLLIRPQTPFNQRAFSTFSEFFDYANSETNSLGIIPGYDFGTDPALTTANNLGHAGVGVIFPTNILAGNPDTATVTASSWAGGGVGAMFDGRRFHNIRQSSYMAWQTGAATDHQAPGKVTPFGTAMRMDEETYIDTIVIYGGRAGLNAFFNAHETNTGQASTIGIGVYTSTNNQDWNRLNFLQNPAPTSDWSNPVDSSWDAFGAVIPIRGDVPSHEVTERVFVFHSPEPIPARYVKMNVYRANNPRNEAAMLQLQLGYSFEVYNTQQSLVSPNNLQHNLLDTLSPLSTTVILRGGDTEFDIVGLTYEEDFTVTTADHGNMDVQFTPEFLAGVDVVAGSVVDFIIGGQTFPVSISTFVGREPGFATGQVNYGVYNQTNPHERPSVGLLLPDNNRVASVERTFLNETTDVPAAGNWTLVENWVQVETQIIEGVPVPIYEQTFQLTFTRNFLDNLATGEHNLRIHFAWGDEVRYVDYSLEILRSHGAFLETYTSTFNVRLPEEVVVAYGVYGGYRFIGIDGLVMNEDFTVVGNVITINNETLLRLMRGEHLLDFLFENDGHVITLHHRLRIQPGSRIDYSVWELQTQEPDNPEANVPLFYVYSSDRLQRREYSPWWYGDTEGEWDYFMTSPRGFTSPNAASSRTELRELTPNADQPAWWYHRGYHSMRVEYRVPYVGLVSGPGSRTAIGQMKPHAGQIEVFIWDDFRATTLALGGFPHTSDLSGVNVEQNEPFVVTYRMIDSVATMYFNDSDTPFFRQNIAGFMDNFYFKAGNYDQNAPRGWPDADVVNSLVAIRELEILHNPVRGRLVDNEGNPHAHLTLTYNLLDAPSEIANTYGRTITGLTTTTDEFGYFEITNIPNGRVSWIGGVAQSVSRTAVVELELPLASGATAVLDGEGIGRIDAETFVIDAVYAHTIDSWREAATIVMEVGEENDDHEVEIVTIVPSAFVTQIPGNQNLLTVTLTTTFSNKDIKIYSTTVMIRNNSDVKVEINDHIVFVSTRGNTDIRQIYLLN